MGASSPALVRLLRLVAIARHGGFCHGKRSIHFLVRRNATEATQGTSCSTQQQALEKQIRHLTPPGPGAGGSPSCTVFNTCRPHLGRFGAWGAPVHSRTLQQSCQHGKPSGAGQGALPYLNSLPKRRGLSLSIVPR